MLHHHITSWTPDENATALLNYLASQEGVEGDADNIASIIQSALVLIYSAKASEQQATIPIHNRDMLWKQTVAELTGLCKQYKLPYSGT